MEGSNEYRTPAACYKKAAVRTLTEEERAEMVTRVTEERRLEHVEAVREAERDGS